MACKSCSSSRKPKNCSYGCRKSAPDARWYMGCGWNAEAPTCRNSSCDVRNRTSSSCGSAYRYPCHPCVQPPSECFPYYCGPCAPEQPTWGCSDNCPNPCPPSYGPYPWRQAVYGFFTQVGTLNIAAGGAVPFNGGSTVENIWKDGGELTLEEEGVYLVTLSANIPATTELTTELDVRVNGVGTPGGTLSIDKEVATDPWQNSIQTVITVSQGAVVTVTSSAAVNLTAESASAPIITLTLVKIS